MLKTSLKTLSLISAGILFLTSCGNDSKTSDGDDISKSDTAAVATESTATEDENEVTYTLPSPLQVASIFKKSGLKFMAGITNPSDNALKYNNNDFVRAVNLGVYSSDLAYTILNKQYQDSKSYLKACRDIGVHLGLQSAFETNNLGKRFDKNIDREDSLIVLVSEIQMQSDVLLEESKQKHITAIAFAGAWIESIYIASKVYATDKNKKVGVSLLEQFTIAENIIKALNANESKEPQCKELAADVNDILNLYKNLEAVKKNENSDEDIDLSKITLSDAEFNGIATKITEVRTKLVK